MMVTGHIEARPVIATCATCIVVSLALFTGNILFNLDDGIGSARSARRQREALSILPGA